MIRDIFGDSNGEMLSIQRKDFLKTFYDMPIEFFLFFYKELLDFACVGKKSS